MIQNKTSGEILAKEYGLCNSLFSQAKGLMFSKQKSLVFEFANERIVSLHMWFVFFPIDVVFLDENLEVVEIKENFKPFSFYIPKNKAKYVLELGSGIVASTGTKVGDVIHYH
jgi:uncharacterized protein